MPILQKVVLIWPEKSGVLYATKQGRSLAKHASPVKNVLIIDKVCHFYALFLFSASIVCDLGKRPCKFEEQCIETSRECDGFPDCRQNGLDERLCTNITCKYMAIKIRLFSAAISAIWRNYYGDGKTYKYVKPIHSSEQR